jgi:hypothetical protein
MSMNVALIKPGQKGPESVLLGNVGSQIANGWRDYYEVISIRCSSHSAWQHLLTIAIAESKEGPRRRRSPGFWLCDVQSPSSPPDLHSQWSRLGDYYILRQDLLAVIFIAFSLP